LLQLDDLGLDLGDVVFDDNRKPDLI